MTVYLAVMDETQNGKGDFTLGGFVGPDSDWREHFMPAWDERVLGGKVRIPYLHMTDIRSPRWRAEQGITGLDAESRVDEAIRVIRSMGSIYPISSGIRIGDWETVFAEPLKKLGGDPWEIVHEPDYLCFIAYAVLGLKYAHEMLPDATKVNFLVEHSEKTTEVIKGFHGHLTDVLNGFPDVLKLLGTIDAEDKKSIPPQAADVLCWYVQRAEARTLDRRDLHRFWKLTKRSGYRHTTTREFLQAMSDHLQDGMRKRGMTGQMEKPRKKKT